MPENGGLEADLGAAATTPPGLSGSAAAQRLRRLAKVEALRAEGTDPYPVTYPRTHTLAEVREAHGSLAAGAETEDAVDIAARVMLVRDHGRLLFLSVKDESGHLQVMASRAEMGDAAFEAARTIDAGDWMGFAGRVVASRTGELSVLAKDCTLLGKALRPLPAKARPLTDPELRARRRYLDLIVTPDARRVADIRTSAIAGIRGFLAGRGYTEVETPVLQPDAGGATARPFITHHNALDIEMYLRIALELHLKRLIAGGYEKVFEIGRVFRNEGVDTRHNPEFTMLECYEAYGDYHTYMSMVEELVAGLAQELCGSTTISYGGRDVQLAAPWRRATMSELTSEQVGETVDLDTPVERLRQLCDAHDVPWKEAYGAGKLLLELYEKTAEHTLWDPTFVIDYPAEVSPLSREHRELPGLVERFEAIVVGRELCNGFSELTDPDVQRARFEDQAEQNAAGDDEAMVVDHDYLRSLDYGLPPTVGLGIGIDRLAMLLADVHNIRDIVLFPTLRPEQDPGA